MKELRSIRPISKMQFLVKKMFVGYIKNRVSAICIAEPLDLLFLVPLVCFCFLIMTLRVIFVSASYFYASDSRPFLPCLLFLLHVNLSNFVCLVVFMCYSFSPICFFLRPLGLQITSPRIQTHLFYPFFSILICNLFIPISLIISYFLPFLFLV